jgi:hypothetical protein
MLVVRLLLSGWLLGNFLVKMRQLPRQNGATRIYSSTAKSSTLVYRFHSSKTVQLHHRFAFVLFIRKMSTNYLLKFTLIEYNSQKHFYWSKKNYNLVKCNRKYCITELIFLYKTLSNFKDFLYIKRVVYLMKWHMVIKSSFWILFFYSLFYEKRFAHVFLLNFFWHPSEKKYFYSGDFYIFKVCKNSLNSCICLGGERSSESLLLVVN